MSEYFWKSHRDVLRAIDGLLASGVPPRNFTQGYYTRPDTGSQQHRQYEIDRDGFTLLAMGFTGAEALKFKLAYIAEFNRMEEALKAPQQAPAIDLDNPHSLHHRQILHTRHHVQPRDRGADGEAS